MKRTVGAVVIAAALAVFSPSYASAQSIDIPSIGVHAPVVPGNLGGSLHTVYGEIPTFGSSVLTGHSYIRGGQGQGAVFDRLPQVRNNSVVSVGRRRFVVTGKQSVAVASYRKMLPRLTSLTGPARLVLVTCTNRNDATGVYARRLIVFAKEKK